jgi:hypothetical protein
MIALADRPAAGVGGRRGPCPAGSAIPLLSGANCNGALWPALANGAKKPQQPHRYSGGTPA